jgi:hypothetical protein
MFEGLPDQKAIYGEIGYSKRSGHCQNEQRSLCSPNAAITVPNKGHEPSFPQNVTRPFYFHIIGICASNIARSLRSCVSLIS